MASTNQQQCSSKPESSSPPWSMSSRGSSQSSNGKSDSFRNGDPRNSYRDLRSDWQRPTKDMLESHNRILFLIAKLTGSRVQVSVKDGSKYEGILYSGTSQGELGIVLNDPHKVYDPITVSPPSSRVQTAAASPSILIMNKDLVSIMSSIMDDDNENCCGDQVEFGEQRELHECDDDKVAGDLIFLDDDDDDDTSFNNKPFEIKTTFEDDDEPPTGFLERAEYEYGEFERYAKGIEQHEKSSAMDIHGSLVEYDQSVDEDRMDEEKNRYSVAPTRPARAPSDYFIDHKVEVFPAMDQDFIYYSTHFDESTIPHFVAPSPMTNHICTCEKRKEKVEQPVSRPLRHYSRVMRGKLYVEKYAQKMDDKEKHLEELVRFHQTFKLNFPIPADIEPLLSKQNQSTFTLDNEVFAQLYERSSTTAKRTPTKKKRPFEFNVHAEEFIPDPEIQEFLSARNRGSAASLSFLFPRDNRSTLKNADTRHLTLDEVFKHPFSKNGVEISAHAIGPTWPFGTTQYNMQFRDDAFEQLFTPSYNHIQYQYPHRYTTPSMNPTTPTTHEHSSTHATTDPQLGRNNFTSPAFTAIRSVTGTKTPLNSQYSPEPYNTAFLYTPLLPENDAPSAISHPSPSHNEDFHQQREPHEYQSYYVVNGSPPLLSPYFVPETIYPNHQIPPPTEDTRIQPMSPQPYYTGSEYSYWRM
ncbi:predicted protein [Lichtheimia corymbifera JMRC:FSU:9682]|uniref:Ataxin 2 SM domain-containing protein n=1 Tax=Lichtheimia corymbifera JMRC:FSU:9682 TaxID=1263082 RepID=A0A068SAE0_9FUNG|nr:predicted protein [Lichtheimia corymbifera JMRC:FSU:9682]